MADGRSRVQLDISGVRAANELDIELNMTRGIPYLRALKHYSSDVSVFMILLRIVSVY